MEARPKTVGEARYLFKIGEVKPKVSYWAIPSIMEDKQKMTFNVITDIVLSEYRMTFEQIDKKSRKREVAMVRHIIFYFCKKYTKLTLSAIGSRLKRDHATVLNSVKCINNLCDTDKEFKQEIERLDCIIKKLASKVPSIN